MKNNQSNHPKVLFFDVNETLLDLKDLKQSVSKALNGKDELVPLWFSKMLHYSLVHTVAGTYSDFGDIGAATLMMVAASNDLDLSEEEAKKALKPMRSLAAHPDVKEGLSLLKEKGFKMVSLTNGTNDAVKEQLQNANLTHFFHASLSIQDIKKYKPHTDVYHWAAKKIGLEPKDCMLIAAHGWDIAGALWADWRAAFIAREGKQLYPLAPKPEINESDLVKVASVIIRS
ncbi:2-haloacid dehalogenase [Flavobacteriaceae bacterium MAR_2010_188]|nr:2-haloacid dehalogenase [Flavobacteriaceae bacterium MAR_2010_188]